MVYRKLMLAACVVIGVVEVVRRRREAGAERDLWHEATTAAPQN